MYKKIISFVISVHLLVILALLFSPPKKIKNPTKHIMVRTLQPSRPVRAQVATVQAPQKTAKASPATAHSVKKQTATPSLPKPKAVSSSKASTTKSTSSKPAPIKSKPISQKKPAMMEKNKPKRPTKPKEEMWKEMDEAFAKIEEKVYSKPQPQLGLPPVAEPLSNPVLDFGEVAGSQEETLISFLHTSLNLPEFGEVKIELTIKKDGTVSQLVVLESESKNNKAYLLEHLPLLRFPLILDKDKKFILTFCNEI